MIMKVSGCSYVEIGQINGNGSNDIQLEVGPMRFRK